MRTTRLTRALPALLLAVLMGACSSSDSTGPTYSTTGGVQGRVTDGTAAVAGAALALTMAGQSARTTTSGADGRYSFAQVPVGTWSLAVTAPAGFTLNGAGTMPVAVTAGGTATQDFTLARAANGSTVAIADFAFSPDTLTVTAGTAVTFKNNDAPTHTVTADAAEFDSGNLATGASYTRTFNTAGTFTYHCAIHPRMVGTIKVQ